MYLNVIEWNWIECIECIESNVLNWMSLNVMSAIQ